MSEDNHNINNSGEWKNPNVWDHLNNWLDEQVNKFAPIVEEPHFDVIDLSTEPYKNARTLPPVDTYTLSHIRKERERKLAIMGIGTGYFTD